MEERVVTSAKGAKVAKKNGKVGIVLQEIIERRKGQLKRGRSVVDDGRPDGDGARGCGIGVEEAILEERVIDGRQIGAAEKKLDVAIGLGVDVIRFPALVG